MSNKTTDQPKFKMQELYGSMYNHKYTSVFHEVDHESYVPHHFLIVDKSCVKDRENIKPIILGSIDFQDGQIIDGKGINGVMDENLIAIVISRLEGFQSSKFACKENDIALTKLQEAMLWLKNRTTDKELKNIEITHKV